MELKDPGIKLFGKKIAFTDKPLNPVVAGQNLLEKYQQQENGLLGHHKGYHVQGGHSESKSQSKSPTPPDKEDLKEKSANSNGAPKTPSIGEETIKEPSDPENDTTDSQQKTLKKPDKILPCPRCNSMDTKFCYFNNYNVNQPRYFCKSCQRYWTSGGTMRNVPVGSGRRKNKNSDLHCRLISMPEALHAARMEALDSVHNSNPKNSGTVLSFGTDSALCESMSCVLNLADKNLPNSTLNGFYNQGTSVSCKGGGGEYGDDCSSGSSITSTNLNTERRRNGVKEPEMHNTYGIPPQVPFFPAVPWACPWNPTVPVQGINHSSMPFPLYPTPYWNCIPWLPPPAQAPDYGPKSPILGKHSREGELLKPSNVEVGGVSEQNNLEKSVLVPKTLRIDDPNEAAKSSIWTSLGLQNDSIVKERVFKAFQPKKDEKHHATKPLPVLHANPAALSRSHNFQETV